MKLEFFDGTSWYSVASENFVNTKVFDINSNTGGQLNINRLNGYPASSSLYLRGDGTWNAPSFSNLITTSSISYEITINNTNTSSTDTGLLVQNNGTDAVNFGFNNSTNEAYIWAYGSSTLKFGTNAIKRMQLLNNGTLDLL